MKRLHELDCNDLYEWRAARQKVGADKYKDKHLRRYGLVDVMEEILDAKNILQLALDRQIQQGCYFGTRSLDYFYRILERLTDIKRLLIEYDELFPDNLCTDEEGGDRIWW